MNHRYALAIPVLLIALTAGACSSDSTSEGGTTTTAVIEGSNDSGPASSDSPTSAPDVTVDDTVVDAEATDPPGASGADCLQGRWIAGQERMQEFIGELLPIPVIIGPGSSYDLQIDGSFFSSVNTVDVTLAVPDGPQMTGRGTGIVSGTFGVNGDIVSTTVESSEGGIVQWSAVIDGNTIELPSAPVEGDAFTFDVNNTTFTCEGDTLTFTAPTAGATVTFDRA